jgi:hypothetical protein
MNKKTVTRIQFFPLTSSKFIHPLLQPYHFQTVYKVLKTQNFLYWNQLQKTLQNSSQVQQLLVVGITRKQC